MLHILRLSIPNVYLLTGERAILIDAGGPRDVLRILEFLKELGIEKGKLSLILCTHGHWDHAGGATQLKAATGAPIAVHRADADKVRRGDNGILKPANLAGYFVLPLLNLGYPAFEPDVLIDDEIDLSSYGVAARIVFTPGHTLGSVSVLSADGAMIVGDLLMGGWLGGWLFPTWPGLHYAADDLDQIYASVRKVLALGPNVIHPGRGTVVRVLLPRVEGPTASPAPQPVRENPLRGTDTILVVDDEPMVRKFLRHFLKACGFTVMEAEDGVVAVEYLTDPTKEVRAILLDLTMPRMDGLEALRKIRRDRPGVPILIMSGFSEPETSGRFAGLNASGFLQKPFTTAQLAEYLRFLLPADS